MEQRVRVENAEAAARLGKAARGANERRSTELGLPVPERPRGFLPVLGHDHPGERRGAALRDRTFGSGFQNRRLHRDLGSLSAVTAVTLAAAHHHRHHRHHHAAAKQPEHCENGNPVHTHGSLQSSSYTR